MKPRVALAVLGLAVLGVLLRLGMLSALPESLRLALALAVLVLLPGAGFVAGGLRPPGGAWLAFPWALGFGLAWNAALILLTRAAGARFTVLLDLLPLSSLLPWGIALWRARRSSASPASGSVSLRGLGLAAVLVAVAVAVLHAGSIGAPIMYYSDSPDHIGSIRRMTLTGDAFPNDAFFKDAGPAGADPRKGLWHPQVAMISLLARVDPADAWLRLPAAIVPLFVLNAALLGFLSRGPTGAAVFAWVQLLLLAGSVQWAPLRKGVYATFLADQLCFATAIAVIADLSRPSRAGRIAAVGLALAAVTCHVYSAIQLALVFGALVVGLALRERSVRGPAARALGTAALLGLASLPYLLWRAHQSYAPVNIIHTESQGLLWLGGGWRVVSPDVLWNWMDIAWVLFPLAWVPLWKYGRRDPAALYTLTTSVAVALVIFDPLAVGVLEPRLGYLLMRMIWMVPLAPLVAWAALELARAWSAAEGSRRLVPAALAAVLLACVAPTLRGAASVFAHPGRYAGANLAESPMRWRRGMSWMDRSLPPGQVVMSDPATSYGVPMMTRHYVESLVDQHSSPSDSLALTRILDARDALDPYAGWERTRQVVKRWGVTAIVVNSDFPSPPPLDYWGPSPRWAAAARARLDSAPAAFEKVYDRDDFTVYRIHGGALDTLRGLPAPRPFVVPYRSENLPVGRRFAERMPVVHRLLLNPRRAAAGDTILAEADWRALEPLPAGCYRVSVRFDQALPGGFVPPAAVAKPARKLYEKLRHHRWRFRDDHLPTGGAYGVDLWRPDQVVRDSFQIVVPPDVAPGYYRVEIRMNRSPHYPNFHLADFFSDHDYYSGVVMTVIEVAPDHAALSRPPAPIPPGLVESH